jgi:hypothetical protein
VHNPSQKHLDAYLRVARYLIKTKDLRIVYGTHDTSPRAGTLLFFGFRLVRRPLLLLLLLLTRTATAALETTSSSGTAQPVHGRSNSAALRSQALKKVSTSRDLRLPRKLSISACFLSTLVWAILVPPTSMWTTRGLLLWAFTRRFF